MAIQPRLNDRARLFYEQLQDHICRTLETADGKQRFHEDVRHHNKGGSGKTGVKWVYDDKQEPRFARIDAFRSP